MALAVTAGCKSDDFHSCLRTDPAPLSKFLPNHKLLVRQPDTFPFHYFYLKRSLRQYAYVYVAPVDTQHLRESSGWAQFDMMLDGTLDKDVGELCDYTRNAYRYAFNKAEVKPRLKVVGRRDLPNTLILETAIISIVPSKAELNALGFAGSFVVPGLGIATSLVSSGSVTIECRVRDSKTGEILAMYADTERDPDALIAVSRFTWTQTARINIKTIAEQTAALVSAKDYRTIRRDFPIQFTSLMSDSNLD